MEEKDIFVMTSNGMALINGIKEYKNKITFNLTFDSKIVEDEEYEDNLESHYKNGNLGNLGFFISQN